MQAQYIQACRKVLGQSSNFELESAIKFWQYQQVWERLLGLKLQPFEKVAERFKGGVFKENGESLSISDYVKRSAVHAKFVEENMREIFNKIPAPETEDGRPVLWS